MGHYGTARALIKRAVKLGSRDSILWSHYARVEERLGCHVHARALFRRACRVNPKDWKAWDSWSALEHRLGNLHAADNLLHRSFAVRFDAQGSFIVLANRLDDRTDHNAPLLGASTDE